MLIPLAAIAESDVVMFATLILAVFVLLLAVTITVAFLKRRTSANSPYTGAPLRNVSDVPYDSAKKILQFLYDKHEYDNRIFSLKRSAFCRETGRIFQKCITWYGTMNVDWNFLSKRYKGNYVSWGSLDDVQKTIIQDSHESLTGFQTERSSKNPAPSAIEPDFVYVKPGPLYVNLETKELLGWQCVPDTEFEVLIVQKPKKRRT